MALCPTAEIGKNKYTRFGDRPLNSVKNLKRDIEEWGEAEGTTGWVRDHSRGKSVCLFPCFLASLLVDELIIHNY